jgi:hypothetical protein
VTRDEVWNKLNRIVADLVCDEYLSEEEAESIIDAAQLEVSLEGILYIAEINGIVLEDNNFRHVRND